MNIHIGTMGWSYSFWKNNFYSSKSTTEHFLEEYSKNFLSVEVNSSFYRVPTNATLEKWKKQTPDGFTFSLKVPKKITHENSSQKNSEYLDYFLKNAKILGSKLGPLLFQFPPSFKIDKIDYLKDLVSILPKENQYAIEIRNKTWLNDQFFNLLAENNIALVLGDGPTVNGINRITANLAYYRWEGNRKEIMGNKGIVEKDRSEDIKQWANKIKTLPNEIEVFGYFSKYFSGHPPTDAKKLLAHFEDQARV